jgi:hypothetical protein
VWPFSRKSKVNEDIERKIDVSKPIENPALLAAFRRHIEERTEETAVDLGKALNAAVYLIPIIADEMRTTPSGSGKVTVEAGSLIKFMNCLNEKGEPFLPAFTDWNEIRQWVNFEVSTIVMPAKELWGFALRDKNYKGIAINPATLAWTLLPSNIEAIVQDAKNA